MNTPMSPNSGYVRKSAVRGLIVALFAFVLCIDAIGLVLVKNYAADQAARRAINVSVAANKAVIYAHNQTTCGLRQLVDTPIKGYQRTLAIQKAAVHDKTITESQRQRAKATVKSTQKTLDGLYNFRAIYATIPPGFDCSTLPKSPPRFIPQA